MRADFLPNFFRFAQGGKLAVCLKRSEAEGRPAVVSAARDPVARVTLSHAPRPAVGTSSWLDHPEERRILGEDVEYIPIIEAELLVNERPVRTVREVEFVDPLQHGSDMLFRRSAHSAISHSLMS